MQQFNRKYTKELLEQFVPECKSFAELARKMGIAPIGSNTMNLRDRCKQYGVDTSHFTGGAHNRGKVARNRRASDLVLVVSEPSRGRQNGYRLKEALLEEGVEYKCNVCDNPGLWNDRPLPLQVDHINGQYWDNRKENLQFICPNCHVQTENWGSKNKAQVVERDTRNVEVVMPEMA